MNSHAGRGVHPDRPDWLVMSRRHETLDKPACRPARGSFAASFYKVQRQNIGSPLRLAIVFLPQAYLPLIRLCCQKIPPQETTKRPQRNEKTKRPQRWLLMVTAAGDRVLYATGHMTDGADSMPGPRHDNRRKSTFSTSCRMQGRCVRLPAKRPVRASAAARRPTKMERERRSHEDEPGAVPPSSVR